MKIEWSRSTSRSLYISETGYIPKNLEWFEMKVLRPLPTWMERQTFQKRHLDEWAANLLIYKKAIERIQYAATISRRDISYVLRKLVRYAENPSLIHCVGVKRLLQYLRGTVTVSQVLKQSRSSEIRKCNVVAAPISWQLRATSNIKNKGQRYVRI